MNWGTKLVLGMALFMGFIIVLATNMIISDKDDLVDKDYYEKGLNYDKDYIRKQNVLNDKAAPEVEVDKDEVKAYFKSPAKGNVKISHASNKKFDRIMVINTGEGGREVLPLDKLSPGQWHLRFEWQSDNKLYLFEKVVLIP